MAGFTFVGRGSVIAAFRGLLGRREGELLLLAGREGSGKSHLLRRLRRDAEQVGSHFVQLSELGFLPTADYRHYAIISELAAAQAASPEAGAGARPGPELLPDGRAFLESLLTEDRRPPREKLLRLFSAASGHLGDAARLVLLLDLGRATGEEAFPLEYLARRLPAKIKVVAAVPEVPECLRGLDSVTVVDDLPALTEAETAALLEFHLSTDAVGPKLVELVAGRYPREPMVLDLAAKLAAETADPAATLGSLPIAAPDLCGELLARLAADQRALVECIARVPSGVDIACLRALTEFSDAELGRLLRSDGIRNAVITQRAAKGPQARLCHELLADAVLEASPDGRPEARTFHQLAAAFFLDALEADPTDAVALAAHGHHVHLAADKSQFIHDFPRTYRAKHSFRLFGQLAEEYQLLIQYCDELGEASINRPACLANLGRVYQELGRHDDALARHREALALYEAADDNAGTAEQLANIASALQTLGQLDEAIEHLQRAASLDEAAGNSPALATDLNNLGILYQQLGRHDEALACHQRALALHEEAGNDLGCANQLANMAAIHRARGDLQAARGCYQKAWVIDTRTGNVLAQINDLCNLGLLFRDMGDMEKAILSYRDAIELDRRVADREAEAVHLRTLGAMHIKLERPDEAIRILQEALEVDRSIGSPGGEAEDLVALAGAYRAAAEPALARDLLERAVALHAELANAEAEAAARRALDAIDRQLRGEAADDGDEPEVEQSQIIQREPASDGLWANLQIVDDDPPGTPAPAPQPQPAKAASPTPAAPAEHDPNDPEHALDIFGADLALEGAEPDPAAGLSQEEHEQASTLLGLATEVGDALRRERDDALQRVAELEAELKTYKELVDSLRSIVGNADAKR